MIKLTPAHAASQHHWNHAEAHPLFVFGVIVGETKVSQMWMTMLNEKLGYFEY